MADIISDPSLPKLNGFAWTEGGQLTPLTARSETKLTEMATAINWGSSSFSNTAKAMPTDFGALTNGSFSTAMNDALNNFGDSISSKFKSFNGMGATEIAEMLNGLGAIGGGVQRFGVKLVSKVTGEEVLFRVMPTINEGRQAMYDDVMMPHHPGLIAKYNHTGPRTWSIGNIKLISRTIAEADENQKIINTLRGWLMPYYGYGTESSTPELLGAPPDILEFTAYGDHNIGKIPVALESFGCDWPNDVDWIHTSAGEPFPVIFNIGSLTLKEAWSAREYSGFDLSAYRRGDLANAYYPVIIPKIGTAPETSPANNTSDISQATQLSPANNAVVANANTVSYTPKDFNLTDTGLTSTKSSLNNTVFSPFTNNTDFMNPTQPNFNLSNKPRWFQE
jgi:hypothetical protein